MRLMKWAMLASIGFGPAFVLADEPAKKNDNPVKFGLRVEVQTDDGKPKVFVLGDGNSAESKDGAKQARQLMELLQGKNPKLSGSITFEVKNETKTDGALKPGQPLTIRVPENAQRQNPGAPQSGPVYWHTAKVKHEKGTYLGITTDEPPVVLRKQLGLAKGMALVIDDVIPGSPAAKAGLQEFDVIQKLDDQLIVNQPQLTVLVRAHKPGDEVKITVIREAKPVVVSAKLAEHDIEVAGGGERFMIEAQLRNMFNGLQPQLQERRELRLMPQGGGGFAPGAAIGAPRPVSKTLNEGNRTYTLTANPWGQTLVVTEGKDHKQIYVGAVTTKDQRATVPADMKEILEKLEKSMPKPIQPMPGSPQQQPQGPLNPRPINQLPPGASVPNPDPNPAPNPAPKKEKDSDAK